MARMESPGEDEQQRVSFRVPDDLLEEFDEAVEDQSRSEVLRQMMRNYVDAPGEDEGLIPPQDDDMLARAYKALARHSGGAAMPPDEAKSIVARSVGVPKEAISRRVLTPLRDRGYVEAVGNPYQETWLRVRL